MSTYRDPAAAPFPRSPVGAILSYLVPGLGQIYQGRVGKGLLFLVCLYGMFFYGMYLGSWKNVYLPNTAAQGQAPSFLPGPLGNVYNRLHFAGQFWIGVAAWPAVWQYANYDDRAEPTTFWQAFERTPSHESEINDLQRNDDKHWDLGWVYTVIAGVLNILVIYDAFAGPAFTEAEQRPARLEEAVV